MADSKNTSGPRSVSGKMESIVSYVILSSLFIIFLIIFFMQFSYDTTRFGVTEKSADRKVSKNDIFETDFSRFSPQGYKPLLKKEKYDADKLYEKINGKAPLYLEAGFKQLVTQRFVDANNKEKWIELYLYDMSSIKNAFSVFSRQYRAEARVDNSWPYAYSSENAHFFVSGNYYGEIIGSMQDESVLQAVNECGKKIREQHNSNERITELAYFENAYLVKGSEKYYLKNAFGFSELSSVFTANYKTNTTTSTVFMSIMQTEKQAKDMANKYISFLVAEGAEKINAAGTIDGLQATKFYGSIEAVFTYKQYLLGVHEGEEIRDVQKHCLILLDTIKKNREGNQ